MRTLLEWALATAVAGLSAPPRRTVIAPGESEAWDATDMMFVRLVLNEPAYRSGARVPDYYVVTLAVGVLRCVSTLDDSGRAPTATDVTAEGLATGRDMAELANAFVCAEAPGAALVTLGAWSPLGPEGGAAGGEWEIVLRVPSPLPTAD